MKLYDLQIFNRWGQLIFQTKDPGQGWDGSFNGNTCQQDTYVWKISVSTIGGDAKELKGSVTLVR